MSCWFVLGDGNGNADGWCSASPLNGEAAELWDNDQAEYQRKVLARHRDLTDEEDVDMGGS